MVIKMKNKKGQMKIQQMVFMLMAVFVFFGLVGMLIIGVKFSGLKEAASAFQEKNAMSLVSKLANSPEFSCGNSFDTGEISCIDADKVMILKENLDKYGGFWGVSDIEIRKIYPVFGGDILCTRGNYPNCNLITFRLTDELKGNYVSNFVSLCRKEVFEGNIYDKCDLAKIMVGYENVE